MAAAGREGANRLRKHFRQKDREEPNKLGGGREHFWLAVARSVSQPVVLASGRTVVIDITDGRFAQKLFGGTIRAKRAGALTIPQTPEAYGRAASVFEHETGLKLFLLGTEFSGRLMAQVGNRVVTEYLLRQSVQQPKDATALPPQAEFEAGVIERAQAASARQIAGQGGNPQ